jgi:hypothetical protein
MTSAAFRLLENVAKRGEISLKDAIDLPKTRPGHTAQYPLVLLNEEGYIGSTLDRQPPTGAEKVREYSLAVSFHVFSFPKDSSGVVHYLGANMPQGVRSSGNVDPDQERVFLKAKSASLGTFAQRRRDRFWTFVSGAVAGVLVGLLLASLRKHFGLP